MIEYAAGFIPGGRGDVAISSIPPSLDRAEVQTRVDIHNQGGKVGDYVVLERDVTEWRISAGPS